MVPRFRSRNLLRPVNRIKHVTDVQAGIVLAVPTAFDLIKAVDAPVIANTNEVQTGSTVNGIFISVEVYATTAAALANAYFSLTKNPGGNIAPPAPNVVGASDNKRFVIHQEMVMLEKKVSGNPRTLFKGVVVIPRGYRRFAPDDRLTVTILSPGVNLDLCMQSHYKEYR